MKCLWSLTPAKIILGGFFSLILTGALLLCLPAAARSGEATPFIDALFTSTSAACVTGLVIRDTATYWSGFGQAVILGLIQIGGMGVVTLAVAITILSGRKIGLKQRSVMQESISAPQVGGIIRLTRFILLGTLLFELLGAAVLAIQFIPQMGIFKGLWLSLFHSVSAFCNAGFDLMGDTSGTFSSLTSYTGNPVIVLPVMILIIVGGLGFFVWEDLYLHRFHWKTYSLQTKIVLGTTVLLLVLPAVFFSLYEFRRSCFSSFTFPERLLAAMLQSVSPRTAGFNSVDLTLLSEVSKLLVILLMLVGGSPGSTAGGIKTTTLALSFLCLRSAFRNQDSIQCCGRQIPYDILRNAMAVFTLYLVLLFSGSALIACLEEVTLMEAAFETASALATVGLSLGITGELTPVSKLILILFMYFGRVGGLTMLYALIGRKKFPVKLPQERITVG